MNDRILPLFALIVAIGIFFGYVRPMWSDTIASINETIVSDDKALAAASDYTARQNVLASARDAIDPESLKRLTVFLPDSVDNVGLILDLNALAARSGLSISNIDVTNTSDTRSASPAVSTKRTDPISSIDLTLSAVGTYTSLQAFLTGVEKSARLLDVRDITVKGSDTGVYSFLMKLRIFWLHS